MTSVLTFVALSQVPSPPKVGLSDTLAVAKAIGAYEAAPWRKLHPKSDLDVTFADPTIGKTFVTLLRSRLGYKNPIPILDPTVLTIVFNSVTLAAPKRLSMDAFVFQGSFPKGFHARYLVATDGKEPRVLVRVLLDRYEIVPRKPDT